MTGERVVVLDGAAAFNEEHARVVATLHEIIRGTGGTVQTFVLRDERIAHCIGCFGCWLETPGLCRSADRGQDVIAAMVHADTVLLVTPVTFGGYSSTLKRLVDHWVQLALPFFQNYKGELHHPLRYSRFPRLVAVGVQPNPDEAEAELFRALVARNALNFHPPSHAAEVVAGSETEDELRARLADALSRRDAVPSLTAIQHLLPEPAAPPHADFPAGTRKALVLVGSPKTKKPSTSGVLGRHLLARLEARGWQGDVLTISAAIRDQAWRERMLDAVDAADLLVLAFPLYIDALPTLLTRALEAIVERRIGQGGTRPQRIAAVVNSGFPEAQHSLPALAICARFAAVARMTWVGGLAMGAGEALSSGVPLTDQAAGSRPPVGHVIAALDGAAAELAENRPLSPSTAALIARVPMPILPFPVWRRFFAFMGGRHWRQEAATHGVRGADLLARPFTTGSPATAASVR